MALPDKPASKADWTAWGDALDADVRANTTALPLLSSRLDAVEAAAAATTKIAAFTKITDPLPVLAPGQIGAYELPTLDARALGASIIAPPNSTGHVVVLPFGAAAGQTLVVAFAHSPGAAADFGFLPAGGAGLASSTIGTTARLEVSTKVLTADDIAAKGTGNAYPYGSVTVAPAFSGPQRSASFALLVTAVGAVQAQVVQSTVTNATSITPPSMLLPKRSLVFTAISKRATGADLSAATPPPGQALVGNAKSGTTAGGETALAVAQYVPVQVPGQITPGAWTLPATTGIFAATIAVTAVN